MDIRFYNTLTRRVEPFEPIDPPNVYMYNCGPTVYDFQHVGNFRSFVFADVLRRFLDLAGYRVHQVMNLTDVGHMTEDDVADGAGQDKMQVAIKRLKEAKHAGTVPDQAVADPNDPYQVAQYYIDAFLEDARALSIKVVDDYPQKMPRPTQHIPRIQQMIQRLLDNEHAYIADDGVIYYSVPSFSAYGKLSGNTIDRLRSGAGGRVLDEHQAAKRHPADFFLWKPDPAHVMKWDSPWGVGYPNWHIECSVMSIEKLGREVIDIHTGGEDNIFPHHECEIAQSCGATGNDTFSRLWMHARYLRVEGRKMSKSEGNFYTLRDVLARGIDPAVIRYELIRSHYRANLNFTFKGLEDSARAVSRLRQAAEGFALQATDRDVEVDLTHPAVAAFAGCLADDLNSSGALGELFTWLGKARGSPDENLAVLRKIDSVLCVLESVGAQPDASDVDVDELCRRIDQARAEKDFDAADAARQQLIDAGYDVQTTKEGTSVRRKLV